MAPEMQVLGRQVRTGLPMEKITEDLKREFASDPRRIKIESLPARERDAKRPVAVKPR